MSDSSFAKLTVDDVVKLCKGSKHVDSVAAKKTQLVINCLRSLAMDAVQQANSGHPGTPMAMAPVGYVLWAKVLNYDPEAPQWLNRDRFVLSMGHASMLLYGLLHLAKVKDVDRESGETLPDSLAVTLDDIKNFRQIGSKCPGHPEVGHTAGVEMTTGPLGQGVASSVGMAVASKWFAATFNRPGFELFDYNVYALAGDGCLQEGVSAEAASLAGHLKLDNLCWIWDNNHITIDGNTAWATSEEIATRFIAYGWNVTRVGDANDLDFLSRAFKTFELEKSRPTLIVVDSHIAWGSPSKQDHFSAHGTPLGEKEVSATKHIYGWPDEKFLVPPEASDYLRQQMSQRGGVKCQTWKDMFAKYASAYPSEASTLRHIIEGTLPADWDSLLGEFEPSAKGLATRQSSAQILNKIAEKVPWLIGGSADLANSCLTTLKFEGAGDFMPPCTGWGSWSGRNMHFGIREHAMGSILNGLALCKLRPFGSTFLVFSDYMKASVRMSAAMRVPSIFIFTHDSIGVGEDGPTHQPIEQLSALRSVPDLLVFRPCDANEVIETWRYLMTLCQPAAVVLSRQPLPTFDRAKYGSAGGVSRGAYIIAGETNCTPDLILMASGSEVCLMVEAHDMLVSQGIKVRSISVPCMGLLKAQPSDFVQSLLPDACRARVSIEAGRRDQWASLTGLDGEHIGMSTFGVSGPHPEVLKAKGFTTSNIVEVSKRVLAGTPQSMPPRPVLKRRRVRA